MSAIDTLCFDNFDPVAGGTGPTIDGFFFHDIGLEDPSLVEMGYTRGCRYTWSGGGEPLAMFQGVKAGDFLVFGFFARFDQRFNDNDKIIIAIKPAGELVPAAQQRRIDVNPVNLDLGAGLAPVGCEPDIRSNQAPKSVRVYKGKKDGTDRWEHCAQAIEVKVRSWRPPSPASDVGWSAEVKVPITAGTDWIPIDDGFGLFFSIIRNLDVKGQTFYAGLQFPRDRAKLTGADGTTLVIADTMYGTGRIGAGLGEGVRFRGDYMGIGRLANPAASPTTSSSIVRQMSKTSNKLVARIENTSPGTGASDITAEFRFGRYGLPPGSTTQQWHDWKQPDGMHPLGVSPKRTAPIALSAGAFGDLTTDWPLTPAERTDFAANPHRCMVATLFSDTDVNFTQASVRANTDFTQASEVSREAEVSGVGYEAPAGGSGELEFLLFTFARAMRGPELLELYDIKDSDARAAVITRNLLTAVTPPSDDEKLPPDEGEFLRIEPGELRWPPDDGEPKPLSFTVEGRSGEQFRLRILGPSRMDDFEWEAFDHVVPAGEVVSIKVFPPEPAESEQRANMYYQVLQAGARSIFEREQGNWKFVEGGAVSLLKDGANALRPSTGWKEALASAQVIMWITFGFLRTGKQLVVDGEEGEVLDETPGEFSMIALHQGLDDKPAWSISGPDISWERNGINRVKVRRNDVSHIDVRHSVLPPHIEQHGDLGPRYVQPAPIVMEWGPLETHVSSVNFTQIRETHGDVLVLEVAQPLATTDHDFVWKPISGRIGPGKSAPVEVLPPQTSATADRIAELRYRVSLADGAGVLETGRVRLIQRGGEQRPPVGWLERLLDLLNSMRARLLGGR
jgi:hypothetical protein